MAMSGQYSNNDKNNSKGAKHVTVYSPYTFANGQSDIDQTKLVPTFELGMLKLSIQPKIQNAGTDFDTFEKDKDSGVSIYLTHTKAKLLLNDIREFRRDPSIANSVGVDSGTGENQGLIQLSNGKEFGKNSTCLVIRRLIIDNGIPSIAVSFAYEFKKDYHYTIRNFDPNTMEFDKIYNDGLEIDQLEILLEQYINAQTNAIAFTVKEQLNYNFNAVNKRSDALLEHFGIQLKDFSKTGGNSNKNSTSIFGGNSGRTFNTTSVDDINNM